MKNRNPKLTRDGVPIDAGEWTEADWADLNYAAEKVRRKLAKRHAEPEEKEPRP